MFLWLLRESGSLSERMSAVTAGDSRVYLTARIVAATVTAFLVALILARPAIRWLSLRFRERVDSASAKLDALHVAKNATPTMGGVFVVAAVLVSAAVWGDVQHGLTLLTMAAAAVFCLIGAVDDWIKASGRGRGLSVRQKLMAQVLAALVFGIVLYAWASDAPERLTLSVPIGPMALSLGMAFPLWAMFVLVGMSNAVNLTDGLDGLAGGCSVMTAAAMAALCYVAGHHVWAHYLGIPFVAGAGEVAVVVGALAGAMLGFLWFNCHPAEVFLGDAGSLPVGAVLAIGALVARQEALLLVAGGMFVVETLSVVLQVASFKLTGRRLIACSPLHNHFVLTGHHEQKIVVRFWIGSAVCAAIAFALLKVR